MARKLYEIAREVRNDWVTFTGRSCVSPYAEPYLSAMEDLQTVYDYFGLDSGRMIVLYFLANAKSWRGPVARRIKSELKSML